MNELFLPLSRKLVQLYGNVQSLADEMRRFYFPPGLNAEQRTFSRIARDVYPYVVERRFEILKNLLDRYEDRSASITALKEGLQRAQDAFKSFREAENKAAFDKYYSVLRDELRAISKSVEDECQKITLASQVEGRNSLSTSLLLSFLVVLFGMITIFQCHRLLKPLPKLITSIRNIANGDLEESLKVNPSARDEFSLLAREVNRMLSALKERDEKIQEQQKEILQSAQLATVGQLSAEIVHEIRNPLNSISLNIDWLSTEIKSSDPEIKKTLDSVAREIARLNQITESYLVRAKLPVSEGGRASVQEVLGEVISFHREENKAQNIRVETEFESNEIWINTDGPKLKQIFLNLFKNSRDAMPSGGLIKVRGKIRDNVSEIEFIDTGFGMNETTLKKSFFPFYTTKTNGTGIGLNLVRRIVEEARGSLQCFSEVGKGTRFVLQFPI